MSEGYSSKAACMTGIESVRKNASEASADESALAQAATA
ncbi:YegP family protein [Streptosporangiaceae bacterium NEAU-GS5]|nr:YegP family protein [Streptosporangiaceae bacterium NEAU-GS5]